MLVLSWYCDICIARFADLVIQTCTDDLVLKNGGCWLCTCFTTERLCFSFSSYTLTLQQGSALAGMRSVSSGRGNEEAFPPGDLRQICDFQHGENIFRGSTLPSYPILRSHRLVNTNLVFDCLGSSKVQLIPSLRITSSISIFSNIIMLLLLKISSSGATVVSVSLNHPLNLACSPS